MKTVDGKIVDVAYFVDSVLYNDDSEHIIIGETRNQLDYAYYSSIAAIREKYPRATISLIVDDLGGDKAFTLSLINEWVDTLNFERYAEAKWAISALREWCENNV